METKIEKDKKLIETTKKILELLDNFNFVEAYGILEIAKVELGYNYNKEIKNG